MVSERATMGVGWMGSVEPEDLTGLLHLIARTSPGRPGTTTNSRGPCFRIRRPNGKLRWVTCRVAPLLDEDRLVKGHITAAIDVTSQRTASEQLEYLATTIR